MARSEDETGVFAELQECRYFAVAEFSAVMLGLLLQAVGVMLEGQ